MNKVLLFFIISLVIFILNIITSCISPIINNAQVRSKGWEFSNWKELNCQIYDDQKNYDTIDINAYHENQKQYSLCRRKKAMHDLEYATLVLNFVIGFLCANLSFLQFMKIARGIKKKIGLMGTILGFCGFVITLVYISFNGYIFTKDYAYEGNYRIKKLFPNGAMYKYLNNKYIASYENEKEDNGEYIKFKDLGAKQYNYDSDYYKQYIKSDSSCREPRINLGTFNKNTYITNCDYIFPTPTKSVENKDLYDRWTTNLVLNVFILIGDLFIFILGLIIFIKTKNDEIGDDTIPIV